MVGFFFCNHLTYRLPFQFVSCIPNFEKKKTIDVSSGHCPPNGPNKRNSRNFSHKFLSILDAIFLKLSSSVRCRRTAFTFQIKIVFKINVNNYNRHTNNAVTLMIQFQGHRSHNQKFTIEMCLLFALQKSSSLAFQNKLFHFIIICEVFLFSFINIILIFPFSSIKYVFIHFKSITHLPYFACESSTRVFRLRQRPRLNDVQVVFIPMPAQLQSILLRKLNIMSCNKSAIRFDLNFFSFLVHTL